MLSAQADAVCGAEYGTRDQDRTNRRNGYLERIASSPVHETPLLALVDLGLGHRVDVHSSSSG